MDNEREISQLVEQSKLVFLREVIEDFKKKEAQYDLGREFAKTKKNRTPLVPLVISALAVAFIAMAGALTWWIQQETENIQIDIQAFSDVNLREVLDGALRLETEMEQARARLEELVAERERQVSQRRSETVRQIELLRSRDLGNAEEERQIAELRRQEEIDIERINAEFDVLISEVQEEIADIQERIDQYDARQLEQAREQEEVLNDQQQLHELELQQQREQYEERIANLRRDYEQRIRELEEFQAEFEQNLRATHAREVANLIARYNPDMSDEDIYDLIVADLPSGTPGTVPFRGVLASEGILSQQRYTALGEDQQELAALIDRLREVPYQNSVPDTLAQIDSRMTALIDAYEVLWQNLAGSVEAKNRSIGNLNAHLARYVFAFDEFATINRETGYIIDPRNRNSMLVFVDPLRQVQIGDIGYVFRQDDELIATIQFTSTGPQASARLVELAGDLVVEPLDKVLVRVQGDAAEADPEPAAEPEPEDQTDTEAQSDSPASDSGQGEDTADPAEADAAGTDSADTQESE